MPCDKAHLGGLLEDKREGTEGAERGSETRPLETRVVGERGRFRGGVRLTGTPVARKQQMCAEVATGEVLLVATGEDISC